MSRSSLFLPDYIFFHSYLYLYIYLCVCAYLHLSPSSVIRVNVLGMTVQGRIVRACARHCAVYLHRSNHTSLSLLSATSSAIQACRVLHVTLCADYNAAIVLAYSNTIKKYCLQMDAQYSKVSSAPDGIDSWMRVVETIVREAATELQGWTVTESLRSSYLQPLHDHGDMLRARLVSWESCLLLTRLHTDSLLSAMSCISSSTRICSKIHQLTFTKQYTYKLRTNSIVYREPTQV